MSFENFIHYARAYGSQMKRWPAQAAQFFHQHAEKPEARSVIAEEEKLDQWLDAYQTETPLSPAFRTRIHNIAAEVPSLSAAWQKRYVSYSALSFMTCAVLGLVIGIQLSGSPYFSAALPNDLSVFTSGANSGGGVL